MKTEMTISVEFLAGTDITHAVTEAKRKAAQWDVAYVHFNFNGASFSIGRNADIEKVVEEWHENGGKPYGICAV